MDNILELIRNEEVKWVKLGEVCTILDSKRKPISKTKRIEGTYPYYGANGIQDYVNGYIFDGTYILMGEDGSVIKKDNTPVLHWVKNSKIWVNNHAHILEEKEEKYNLRYIYYYLSTVDVSSIVRGTPPKITQANMKDIEIPIPSLELQEKIVKILDTFTLYQEKIAKELEQRKKQYNYYKDMLLSQEYLLKKAKELCGKDASVQWQTLENVFNIVIGGDLPNNVSKEKTEENKIPILSNGKNEKAIYGYTNIAKYETESITISARGTIGWTNYISFPFYPIVRLIVLMPKIEINCKYAYYYLKSIEDKYNISKGGIPQLTKPMIINNKIPIPPLEVQEWIVNTLYPFYKISYDLNKGLSKEIKLRAKQYEYYREQLLDFNK